MVFILLIPAFPSAANAGLSDGQIVTQGETLYYDSNGNLVAVSPVLGENSVVSVSKTVAGTNTENEFEVNLEVKTTVDISDVTISDDAAVVLVLDMSSSMGSGPSSYFAQLQNASIAFLESFKANANGSARFASLVTYNSNATIQYDWVDITVQANYDAVVAAINGISSSGNTFMEGGLMLARNLLHSEAFDAKVVDSDGNLSAIANRSVILFTDGLPNRGGLSYSTPSLGFHDKGYTLASTASATSAAAQASARTQADLIKIGDTDHYNAKVYTIAYGTSAGWMGTNLASSPDCAFAAGDQAGLNEAFNAIQESIKRWAEAWTVTDPMGSNIDYITGSGSNATAAFNPATNTLTWNLREENVDPVDNVYTYSYSYKIRLDNTETGFVAGDAYPTSEPTKLKLSYVMHDRDNSSYGPTLTANFKIPEVKGFLGSLAFNKVNAGGEILSGCEFELATADGAVSLTETSGADGVVNFDAIPSGFTYMLAETALPAELQDLYALSGETVTVTIAMGIVSVKDSSNNSLHSGFDFINQKAIYDFTFKKIDGNIFIRSQDNLIGKNKILPLPGAEFTVFKLTDEGIAAFAVGENWDPKSLDAADLAEFLVPADLVKGTAGAACDYWELYDQQTSDKEGDVTLSLQKAFYMLVETKAPVVDGEHYVLPAGQWFLTVDSTLSTPIEIKGVAANGKQPPTFVNPKDNGYNLMNMRVNELPQTGGMGTIIFSVVGLTLIAGAAIVLIRTRKTASK